MKQLKVLLILALLLSSAHFYAQNKGMVGFSFSAINANAMLKSAATSYNPDFLTTKGQGFMSFSVDYWYPINHWLEVETGVNYSLQHFIQTTDYPAGMTITEPLRPDKNVDYHVVNLPVGMRVSFLKYGFINSGILIDVLNEPGIGSYFGAGLKIGSEIGFGMFINPYVKMHSILPVDFDANANRIVEAGVKIGVTYNFDNAFSKGAGR